MHCGQRGTSERLREPFLASGASSVAAPRGSRTPEERRVSEKRRARGPLRGAGGPPRIPRLCGLRKWPAPGWRCAHSLFSAEAGGENRVPCPHAATCPEPPTVEIHARSHRLASAAVVGRERALSAKGSGLFCGGRLSKEIRRPLVLGAVRRQDLSRLRLRLWSLNVMQAA